MKKLLNRLATTVCYVVLFPFMSIVVMIIDGSFPDEFAKEWWQDMKYIWGFDNEY